MHSFKPGLIRFFPSFPYDDYDWACSICHRIIGCEPFYGLSGSTTAYHVHCAHGLPYCHRISYDMAQKPGQISWSDFFDTPEPCAPPELGAGGVRFDQA